MRLGAGWRIRVKKKRICILVLSRLMTLCNKSETTGAVTINIDSFLLIIHQPRSTDLFGVKKIPRNQKDLIRVSGTAVTRWSTTKILPKACFRAKCPAENIGIGIFDSEFRPSLNGRIEYDLVTLSIKKICWERSMLENRGIYLQINQLVRHQSTTFYWSVNLIHTRVRFYLGIDFLELLLPRIY